MALRDQPYLPLYVQDYLTDEKLSMCSWATQGIYIKLLCLLHKSDPYGTILLKQNDKHTQNIALNFAIKITKLLPIDKDTLCGALSELIEEGCLTIQNDTLFQKRMVRDNEISEIRADAGSRGGKKTQSFAKAKTQASTEYESEGEIEVRNKKGGAGENKINIPFETFWDLYDKKEDRIKCERKWSHLTNKEREECIKKLPAYIKSTPDKKFRKNPATYLNNKSWENEIIPLMRSTFGIPQRERDYTTPQTSFS